VNDTDTLFASNPRRSFSFVTKLLHRILLAQGSILLRPRSRRPSLAPVVCAPVASTSGAAFGAPGGATLHGARVQPVRRCAPERVARRRLWRSRIWALRDQPDYTVKGNLGCCVQPLRVPMKCNSRASALKSVKAISIASSRTDCCTLPRPLSCRQCLGGPSTSDNRKKNRLDRRFLSHNPRINGSEGAT